MKKNLLMGSLLVLSSLIGFTQLSAQIEKTSGKFIIYYGEKESGVETYSISESKEGFQLTDRAEFQVAGQNILVNLNLWLDPAFRAVKLSMDGETMGSTYQVSTRFEEGKAINRLSGIKDTTTEVPVHQDALILPNGLFFPYAFLVQRYDLRKGGKQKFFGYVVPQMEMTVEVEDRGKEMVNFKTTQAELRKLFVSLGGMVGVNLWIDDKGEILKLNIPIQGIEVFREGYEPAPARVEPDTLKKFYSSQEVTFESGKLKLAGTVTIPQDGKKQHPAVIIISGSGPQDRNGVTPELKFSVQYKSLAHALSNAGILVLRYDERGVGESEGDFETATLSDFVSDVKAGIGYLKQRSDVDETRICLIGHSEGGIIAPMIASEDPTIKAIVLMAGTAKPLDQVITEQQEYILSKQHIPEETKRKLIQDQKDFFAWVRGEKEWDEEKLKQLGSLVNRKQWLLEHFQHDPLQTIKKVKCKVLILQGGKDRQVFEKHAHLLDQALQESGNQNHLLKIFPDLDHLFCRTEGEGDYAEYADTERPLDPEFLDFLTDWLKKEL